jgi:hypothetical protein
MSPAKGGTKTTANNVYEIIASHSVATLHILNAVQKPLLIYLFEYMS